MIMQQKKVILLNYEQSRRNPDSSLVIYLTADKVVQYRLVSKNSREKEEENETSKKTATQNLHLKQKLSEAFSDMPRLHE